MDALLTSLSPSHIVSIFRERPGREEKQILLINTYTIKYWSFMIGQLQIIDPNRMSRQFIVFHLNGRKNTELEIRLLSTSQANRLQ